MLIREASSQCHRLCSVTFEDASQLLEFSDKKFKQIWLREICIRSSPEVIGENGFSHCPFLTVVPFERCSRLRHIGNHFFSRQVFDRFASNLQFR
jgi:hypothetical protein